ncbi:hypothetical protein QJS04_geneDACA011866 [Acorus gramineus]|uniref:Bifunctional inhibitor/plant lipid transfer protein/seed storage helical domain-containing protein n=1 Tax=Acorus gramineus TaxID=55184 RepID=A0AAV9AGD8_ACOGR|nr:hypothetical protein QJS04_geneDACA011866 [Acorus gramineus]
MGSSSKLLMFLALATLVQVNVSQNSGDEACVTQLMPCQPELKTTTPPSAECCLNLKKEILNDPLCLCRVLTDAALLKSINITQAEALNLPKRCGAQADVSLCKNAL